MKLLIGVLKMTKEEIKQKEDRLAEMYLAYYRMLVSMNEKYLEQEKLKVDLINLAKEIEEDYLALSEEKEKQNGEELC